MMVTKKGVKKRRLGYIKMTRNSQLQGRNGTRDTILYYEYVWGSWRLHWVRILITIITVHIDVKASYLSNSRHFKKGGQT